MSRLSILLSDGENPELLRTEFVRPGGDPRLCVRGKTAGAYIDCGCFQWTPAVQAMCILLLRSVASGLREQVFEGLIGEKATPAASLDYALQKKTSWLSDIFGFDSSNRPFAKKLFKV